jgi:hypothetical protein
MNNKVLTIGLAVLTALLALVVTGMAAYAGGQSTRMADYEVKVAVRTAVKSAERRADVHTERLLNDQEDAHRKQLKAARKQAREHGYRVGKKSGYQEGNEAGYSSGYSSGNSTGIETGKDEATDELWCSDDSDVDLPACGYSGVTPDDSGVTPGDWDY